MNNNSMPTATSTQPSLVDRAVDVISTSAKNLTHNPDLHYERPESYAPPQKESLVDRAVNVIAHNKLDYMRPESVLSRLDPNVPAPNFQMNTPQRESWAQPLSGEEGFVQSLVTQESSGNYGAIGKANTKGQRAYGKYQVMDYNIPTWTKEALGRAYSVKEFLQDPAAQDRLAKVRLGKIYKTVGPADAASIWFSGGTLAQNAWKMDATGKLVKDYVLDILGRMVKSGTFSQSAYAAVVASIPPKPKTQPAKIPATAVKKKK